MCSIRQQTEWSGMSVCPIAAAVVAGEWRRNDTPATGAYPGFEVGGCWTHARAKHVAKNRTRPLIYLKVRRSPVLARCTEARCEVSHSFYHKLNACAGKFLVTFITVLGVMSYG